MKIGQRATVGDKMPLEIPFSSEDLIDQKLAGTTNFVEGTVVGAHDRFDLCLRDEFLERRQVRVVQLTSGHYCIEDVTILFRPRMNSVMLGTGRGFEIFGVIALQTLHER